MFESLSWSTVTVTDDPFGKSLVPETVGVPDVDSEATVTVGEVLS